jgi:hypothetical protein
MRIPALIGKMIPAYRVNGRNMLTTAKAMNFFPFGLERYAQNRMVWRINSSMNNGSDMMPVNESSKTGERAVKSDTTLEMITFRLITNAKSPERKMLKVNEKMFSQRAVSMKLPFCPVITPRTTE